MPLLILLPLSIENILSHLPLSSMEPLHILQVLAEVLTRMWSNRNSHKSMVECKLIQPLWKTIWQHR